MIEAKAEGTRFLFYGENNADRTTDSIIKTSFWNPWGILKLVF